MKLHMLDNSKRQLDFEARGLEYGLVNLWRLVASLGTGVLTQQVLVLDFHLEVGSLQTLSSRLFLGVSVLSLLSRWG